MSLYSKLVPVNEFRDPKIASSILAATILEVAAGRADSVTASSRLGCDLAEQAEFDSVAVAVRAGTLDAVGILDACLLAENRKYPYDSEAAFNARLGL